MPKNKYAMSDEVWKKIQPWIPARNNPHPRGGGRKPKDDRQVFEAILFVLRYGCRWNALNATGLAPSSTVHDRFRKWTDAGVFHRLRDEGLLEYEAMKGIDWSWLSRSEAAEREEEAKAKNKRRARPVQAWKERPRTGFGARLHRDASDADRTPDSGAPSNPDRRHEFNRLSDPRRTPDSAR